ncbi:sphingosine kinase [Auritidibacter sp. NML130574]|nr:sphingosine kinase [Auritidibacter sp. NML130574]PXA76562.1 sphingosine kinase [Auritidibacter sp. NML100628]
MGFMRPAQIITSIALGVGAIAPLGWALKLRKDLHEREEHITALLNQLQRVYELPEVSTALQVPGHIGVVMNPHKEELVEVLAAVRHAAYLLGVESVEHYPTQEDDPGVQASRDALNDGASLVIAAGGDGTVRAVAEALVDTEADLGIIPVGTGNLLARNLNLPYNDIERCVGLALQGTTRAIDTIDLTVERTDESVLTSTFVVIAGAGIDAEIMSDTRDGIKQAAGWLAYGEAGMRKLPGKRKPIWVSIDDQPARRSKVRSVMIANCGMLQGGIRMVPHASIYDGLLDVMLLAPRNLWDWARVALNAISKNHAPLRAVDTMQGQKCVIELAEPMISQQDGDATGTARRITATVNPGSLRVRC